MPQGTVSRNIAKLGSKLVREAKSQYRDIGYGLVVNRDDAVDPRRNAVYLTSKGKQLKAEVAQTFAAACQKYVQQTAM